jgi:putative flippase GtrA
MIFDRKFLKFIVVGVVNTLVGAAIMFGLYNLAHVGYWVASACNYALTSILSFFLNKRFTFGVKHYSVFMATAFIVNIVAAYLVAYDVAKPIVNYFLENSPKTIRENIGLIVGMCLFTGLNYLGQRFVVFKVADKKEATQAKASITIANGISTNTPNADPSAKQAA